MFIKMPFDGWTEFPLHTEHLSRDRRNTQEFVINDPAIILAFERCRIFYKGKPHFYIAEPDDIDFSCYGIRLANYGGTENNTDCQYIKCFCTDEELAALIKQRYPKTADTAVIETVHCIRWEEFIDPRTKRIYPNIDIPVPYCGLAGYIDNISIEVRTA